MSAAFDLPNPISHERYCQSGDLIFAVPVAAELTLNASTASIDAVCSYAVTEITPNRCVAIYSLSNATLIRTLRGHDSVVVHIYRDAWCEKADYLVTQTLLGTVYIWILSDGQLESVLPSNSEILSRFLMSRQFFPLQMVSSIAELHLDIDTTASNLNVDDDAAMERGLSATVCLYENQRYYPMIGWSSRLLPMDRPSLSNENGTRPRTFESFPLLDTWNWTDDWKVVRDEYTDVEGWSYAIDLKNPYNGAHRKAFLHSVRRRKWVRRRAYNPLTSTIAIDSSASLAEQIGHLQPTRLEEKLPTKDVVKRIPSRRKTATNPITAGKSDDKLTINSKSGEQVSGESLSSPSPALKPKSKRSSRTLTLSSSFSSESSPSTNFLEKPKAATFEFKQKLKSVLLSRAQSAADPLLKAASNVSKTSPSSRTNSKRSSDDDEKVVNRARKPPGGSQKLKIPQTLTSSHSENELHMNPHASNVEEKVLKEKVHTTHKHRKETTIYPNKNISPTSSTLALFSQLPPGSSSRTTHRIQVWECQRHYPIVGWSSRLLPTDPPPWHDPAGHACDREHAELSLELDWQWTTPWQAEKSENTDSDGWQYAIDFHWEFFARRKVLHTVRRRLWFRMNAASRGPDIDTTKVQSSLLRAPRITRRNATAAKDVSDSTLKATAHSHTVEPIADNHTAIRDIHHRPPHHRHSATFSSNLLHQPIMIAENESKPFDPRFKPPDL